MQRRRSVNAIGKICASSRRGARQVVRRWCARYKLPKLVRYVWTLFLACFFCLVGEGGCGAQTIGMVENGVCRHGTKSNHTKFFSLFLSDSIDWERILGQMLYHHNCRRREEVNTSLVSSARKENGIKSIKYHVCCQYQTSKSINIHFVGIYNAIHNTGCRGSFPANFAVLWD